jgi:hypothetical protein
VAGASGAAHLVLIKPPGARGNGLVDPHFLKVLPAGVTPLIVPADESEALTSALAPDLASP